MNKFIMLTSRTTRPAINWVGLILGLILFTACRAGQTTDLATAALPEPQHTPAVAEVVQAVSTPTPIPTPTAALPTNTPLPQPTEPQIPESPPPSDTPPPTPSPTNVSCDGGLEATVSNAEGPYYKSGAPERTVLVEPEMTGTRLLLSGQVLTTDCQPVAGALLDFWQANDQGEYDNVGFTLRGQQFADETGHYRLETLLPARYSGRPPHIHVKVNTPGGPVLTTQIYFEGQPGNDSDGLIEPSLIVPLIDTAEGGVAATFNFVLAAEQAAPVLQEYSVPSGSRPHDVSPAPDGGVWYTAQGSRCPMLFM